MELTKQVPSLELCKRMKELGWNKETVFNWHLLEINNKWTLNRPKDEVSLEQYPAPTVAELGEAFTEKMIKDYFRITKSINGKPLTDYISYRRLLGLLTDPNKLAKMWIYLKENNLIP